MRAIRGGQLRRLWPLDGGRERGQPIARHYWEEFLRVHQADVRGRALEIGSTQTLHRIGGTAVTQAEAMDVAAREGVSIVADLSRADSVPAESFDCLVIPFTMHLIYDLDAALYHALRLLKPGGVLLVNFPCVDYYFPTGLDMGTGKPLFVFWWFTPIQVENLMREAGLPADSFTLTTFGNLFARVAYQMNLPAEEMTKEERDHRDAGHPLMICARIVKPGNWMTTRPGYRDPWTPKLTPAIWTRETGHYPPV